MDFGLVGAVFQAIGLVASLIVEQDRRRRSRNIVEVAGTLQRLDPSAFASSVSDAKLAGYMRGAMTAALARPIIASPGFSAILQELLVASIVDLVPRSRVSLKESAVDFISDRLVGAVAPDDAHYFAGGVVDSIESFCIALVERLRADAPEALSAIQQVDLSRRALAVLESIDRHVSSMRQTTASVSSGELSNWLASYRRQCEALHGYITPPDFDTNRKLSMEALYVIPTVQLGSRRRDASRSRFEEFRDSLDRSVLLGDPGGGKSTLSNYLTAYFARDRSGVVPFHVTLREFTNYAETMSIAAFIESQLGPRYQIPGLEGIVEHLLLSSEALVIFDGLDELVDTTKRRAITTAVEQFALQYPLAKILVTSRRVGYDQARLDPLSFKVWNIGGFQRRDVEDYVTRWFLNQDDYEEAEAQALARAFIVQSESVPDLRSNPLMLALMCIIFRGENFIPRNRPAVYEKCATLLFEKWDGHRAIEVPLRARSHVDAAMKYIAFWMLSSRIVEVGVRYDQLVDEMTSYLHPRAFDTSEEARAASAEFVDFCKGRAWVFSDAGTTADGEPLYTFTHRTFMEYFAAFHLTRINDTPERLAHFLLKYVAREEWDVVAQLAVQIKDRAIDQGSERSLSVMLHDTRRRTVENRANVLAFIARCMGFATVSPSLARELTESILALALAGAPTAHPFATGSPFRAWFELVNSTQDDQAPAVVEGHKSSLRLAFTGDGDELANAVFVVLYGLTRRKLLQVTRRAAANAVLEGFDEIGRVHRKEILRFVKRHPSAAASLAVSGLEVPTRAIQLMRAAGLDFGQMFFEEPCVGSPHLPLPSYAIFLTRFLTVPFSAVAYRETSAEEMSAAFLGEFAESRPRSWRGQIDSDPRRRGYLILQSQHVDPHMPSSVADAAAIAALGLFEDGSRGLDDARIGRTRLEYATDGGLVGEGAPTPLSNHVREFASEWVTGGAQVFELVTRNELDGREVVEDVMVLDGEVLAEDDG